MNKLMSTLMLSCRKASELIDKQSVVKLSYKERVLLQLHTSMCDGCKAYQKQSRLLDNYLHKHIQMKETNLHKVENKDLKKKIISKL